MSTLIGLKIPEAMDLLLEEAVKAGKALSKQEIIRRAIDKELGSSGD